jgi:hypothetical protein
MCATFPFLKAMRLFIVLFALLLLSQRTYAQRTSAGVANAVDQLRLALLDPTEARLAALVADSLSYGHSNGKIEDKAEFMRALLSGESDFKSMTLSEQRISVVGDVAWVRHVLQGEISSKNVPATLNLSVLLVWVYQKKEWRLLARQAVKR